jgi:hypothetical protein
MQLSLAPFLRLLVAYLSSALSHMQRAVRKDALHFLRLMLDAFGAQMWAFQTELLPIFLSILADRDVVNDAQIAKCGRFCFFYHSFIISFKFSCSPQLFRSICLVMSRPTKADRSYIYHFTVIYIHPMH